ncbi:MAG: hypothetical protein K0S70_1464, partial [Microbacterium sp.]|nr:hypothetical protein [Microbacterium sp.]
MDDSGDEWFEGVLVRRPAEAVFVDALRGLAPAWRGLGIRADRSLGVPVAIPMVGAELTRSTAPLNWVWVVLLITEDELRIECRWGDESRFDDWGPVSGNAAFSAAGPEHLARLASDWIRAQAVRPVLHERWSGFRGGDRWRFEDDGAVLWDSRRFPKPRRAP